MRESDRDRERESEGKGVIPHNLRGQDKLYGAPGMVKTPVCTVCALDQPALSLSLIA